MFVIDKKNKIILTKGDTATMFVEVFDLDNNQYKIQDTDEVKLTVRKNANAPVSFEKIADPEHYIIINPLDTADLKPGLYVYDVQLKTADDNVYTIIPISYFEVASEVSV